MKKSFILRCINFSLCMCLFAVLFSCKKEQEDVVLWDINFLTIMMYIDDANGNDLLDENNSDNILGDDIRLLYKGETSKLDTAVMPHTRSVGPPTFYGLCLKKNSDSRDALVVGEFSGERAADETFIIDWGDGTNSEIRFVYDYETKGTELTILNSEAYCDGELVCEDLRKPFVLKRK